MEPAVTNRIIHSHPAPGCTGPVLRVEYSPTEWALSDIFTDDTRYQLDTGWTVRIEDRIYVDPIAFYNHRCPLSWGAAA